MQLGMQGTNGQSKLGSFAERLLYCQHVLLALIMQPKHAASSCSEPAQWSQIPAIMYLGYVHQPAGLMGHCW